MSDATGPLLAVSATDAPALLGRRHGRLRRVDEERRRHLGRRHDGTAGRPGTLSAVAFTDARNGWAGGSNLLLHTRDGGKTWTSEMSGTFDVYALCCPGDGSAWAAGDTRAQGSPSQPVVWHNSAP